MIQPSLDFTSELFNPHEALHSNAIFLPYPKIKTYNNVAEYYSHTFLRKGFESDNPSKKQVKTRARNYEWYYDTLGLNEYQRNIIQCTKKIKRRPGKKPVSVVTIPGSPLRSKKVTVCKSNFKEYCRRKYRRKYRSLNVTSAIMNSNSEKFETFPLNSNSIMPSMQKSEPSDTTSVLTLKKLERSSFNSTKTEHPFSLFGNIKSSSNESLTPPCVKAPVLPSTSCVMKSELSDSSNDSFTDDVLIFKMKSNLRNVPRLPISLQKKHKPWELSSKRKHSNIDKKYVYEPHQIINGKRLLKISESDYLNSSNDDSLNVNSNMNFRKALNGIKNISSSQVKDSNLSVQIQKKHNKNHKKSTNGELKTDHKTVFQKSGIQNTSSEEKPGAYKENSINDAKSNNKSIKKYRKSALKSHKNVLDNKKNSITFEINSKSNIVSKIKTESSAVINHCTCSFPCGLSNLCTCGYYANAKEALSKFKIPRKRK